MIAGKKENMSLEDWYNFYGVVFREITVILHTSGGPAMGKGILPNWLKNKKSIIAIDSFNDNLCVWRCIAIYRLNQEKKDFKADKLTQLAIKECRDYYKDLKINTKKMPLLLSYLNCKT